MQVLELALREVNRQVSREPLLELRAPLVRPLELLQVVELAPRLVPLNLLLELRVQLVLLDRTPLCSGAACWPFTRADKKLFRVNRRSDTDLVSDKLRRPGTPAV